MALFLSKAWKLLYLRDPVYFKARKEGDLGEKNDWNKQALGDPDVVVRILNQYGKGMEANLVLPAENGRIHLFHHCFIFGYKKQLFKDEIEDDHDVPDEHLVAGVVGIHRYAPLSTVKLSEIVKIKKNLHRAKKYKSLGAPTLEMFLDCKSAKEFATLRNDESSAVEDFGDQPNHFWINPAFFYAIFDKYHTDVSDPSKAGLTLINYLLKVDREGEEDNARPQGELSKQAYPLLKFLWGCAVGVFQTVNQHSCPWSDSRFIRESVSMLSSHHRQLDEIFEESERFEKSGGSGDPPLDSSVESTKKAGADGPSVRGNPDEAPARGSRTNDTEQPDQVPVEEASEGSSSAGDRERWTELLNKSAGQASSPSKRGGRKEVVDDERKPRAHRFPDQAPRKKSKVTHHPARDREVTGRSGRFELEDDSSDDGRHPSDRASTHRWHGYGRNEEVEENQKGPDDADLPQDHGSESEDDRRPRSDRRGTSDGHLNNSVAETLSQVAELLVQSQTRFLKDQRESKSFLKNLPEAQKALFKLLSARKIRAGAPVPEMSPLVKTIDRGANPRQIVSNIRFEIKDMGGDISVSGFANFITSGFYNPDSYDRPGGFTVMMFKPRSSKLVIESTAARKQRIKELFGTKGIDDDEADLYVKNDYYIALTLDDLIDQLKVCEKTMGMLTVKGGIGTEIYRLMADKLIDEYDAAEAMFRQDKLFSARVLYMVDVIQNRFFRGLYKASASDDPYDEAIYRGVDRIVRDSFFQVFGTFHLASMNRNALPALFLDSINETEAEEESDQRRADSRDGRASSAGGRSRGAIEPEPAWFKVSRERPPEGVALPEGKSFQDFFVTDGATNENAKNWPRYKHHRNDDRCRLCIRYLTTGRCNRGGRCMLTHVHFGKLNNDVKTEVKDRLRGIYSAN